MDGCAGYYFHPEARSNRGGSQRNAHPNEPFHRRQ